VIRIDQLWLCTAPMDMRAGAERLMSCVVQTTGAARAHHGYLFANARATRIKLLVHDGSRAAWAASPISPSLALLRFDHVGSVAAFSASSDLATNTRSCQAAHPSGSPSG